jgi:nicotinic acid mononucleotide adenylyltransferase
MAIQEEYPAAHIYFIMGDDKMKLLVHLCKKRDFVKNFKVILYSRNDVSLMSSLAGVNIPSDYLNNIVMCPQPEGISGVSSSLIRERLMRGESCDDLLYPGVAELLKDTAGFKGNINKSDVIQKDMKYHNLTLQKKYLNLS